VLLTKLDQDDQIKEDEMSGACSMHGKNQKCLQNFGQNTLEMLNGFSRNLIL
jgi:hypothetical protein